MKEYLTDTSRVTSKYQTVIPARIRAATNLRMNEQLTWQVIEQSGGPVMIVSAQPKNWAQHLSGLGKRIWRGVDADAYLKQMKEEWQK